MEMEPQEQNEWCWAAVAVSVDRYLNTASTLTQCQLAKSMFPGEDCCNNPDPCDRPEKLQDALMKIGRLRGVETNGLQFAEVQETVLRQHLPLCVRIAWAGGGAHFVAIDGCSHPGEPRQLVHVVDPAHDDSTMDFNDFLSAYQGMGRWTATFQVKG